MSTSENKTQTTEQQAITPSIRQPAIVYLRRHAHRIPLGNNANKYFVVDKITFDCPIHSPEYESEQERETFAAKENDHGVNAGNFTKGHRITLYARAGTPYIYKHKSGEIFYIFGYSINGTEIHITPKVIGSCAGDWRYSEELFQETHELYARRIEHKEVYSSDEDGIKTIVREVS